jgi:hypothetical protein
MDSWVATKRVPIWTPSAPKAKAATNPLASAIPPRSDYRNLDCIDNGDGY